LPTSPTSPTSSTSPRLPGFAASLALAGLVCVGCAHSEGDAPPLAASSPAPEPPAPATAISALLQEKAALGLNLHQIDQLQALDHELQVLNGPLESKLAALEPAAPPGQEAAPAGGGGFRGGRMGGMGMGRGRMGGRGRGMGGGMGPPGAAPAGMAPRNSPAPPGSGSGRPRSSDDSKREADAETVRAKMFEHHTTALRAAFDLLDATQRQRARQILDDNGYDTPETP
jgi:hypothetical protein